MRNRRYVYLTEGENEESLINAMKIQPSLVLPGKVKKFNVIQDELSTSQLMTFAPGSTVVLVFDTDVEMTEHLRQNLKLLKNMCKEVEVLTVPEVLNFEDEIQRATDVKRAPELTKSASVSEFKAAINRMKPQELRNLLRRHSLGIDQLWIKTPPKSFGFITQDGGKVKLSE